MLNLTVRKYFLLHGITNRTTINKKIGGKAGLPKNLAFYCFPIYKKHPSPSVQYLHQT